MQCINIANAVIKSRDRCVGTKENNQNTKINYNQYDNKFNQNIDYVNIM